MTETKELDTKQEAASPNGHDTEWLTFDNDDALLQHILSKKPAEELVDAPEWEVRILCRALSGKRRMEIETLAYDTKTKTTDFKRAFYQILMYGCYNPATGNLFFKSQHQVAIMEQIDGAPIGFLALKILRLSHMLASDAENAKKN